MTGSFVIGWVVSALFAGIFGVRRWVAADVRTYTPFDRWRL